MDTEGKLFPEDVANFFARGEIDESKVRSFAPLLKKKRIECRWIHAADPPQWYR